MEQSSPQPRYLQGAFVGAMLAGALTFGVGLITILVEDFYFWTFLSAPENLWMVVQICARLLALTAGLMVLVFALLCPVYILVSPRPRPVLLGAVMAIFLWILDWTSITDPLQTAWENWFGPVLENDPGFYGLVFFITLTSSVFAVALTIAIEHGIARLRPSARRK